MAKLTMIQAINLGPRPEMMARGRQRRSCSARTSASTAASSAPPRACSTKYGEARVIDTPLAESAIVGTAIGMAMAGLRPVAEMQFCGFSYLAIAQLEGHASRIRNRTRGQVHGADGGAHPLRRRRARAGAPHREPRGGLRALPRAQGGDPLDAAQRARAAASRRSATPTRWSSSSPSDSYRAFREEVPEDARDPAHRQGRRWCRRASDITLVAWGAMCRPAEQAAAADRRAARRQRRADRPAHDLAAGRRHHHRVGTKDRPLRRRAGGAAELRRVERRSSRASTTRR